MEIFTDCTFDFTARFYLEHFFSFFLKWKSIQYTALTRTSLIHLMEMFIYNITSHIDKGALCPVGEKTIQCNNEIWKCRIFANTLFQTNLVCSTFLLWRFLSSFFYSLHFTSVADCIYVYISHLNFILFKSLIMSEPYSALWGKSWLEVISWYCFLSPPITTCNYYSVHSNKGTNGNNITYNKSLLIQKLIGESLNHLRNRFFFFQSKESSGTKHHYCTEKQGSGFTLKQLPLINC